jgi:phosphoribosylformylglycinamidine cyclo-ligase
MRTTEASLARITNPISAPLGHSSAAMLDPRAAGFVDPIIVSSSSGIGPKLKIAIAMGRLDTIGIDLVAQCANDLLSRGARPLYFQYYLSCGSYDRVAGQEILSGITRGCVETGCVFAGGSFSELPGVYEGSDFDLAGFCAGAAERTGLLPRADMRDGDVLLGMGSRGLQTSEFGQIRRIVNALGLHYHDGAPFAPGLVLGEALLRPARCYAPYVLPVLMETKSVKGVIYVSEGGLAGSIIRSLPVQLAARVDLRSWRMPSVFQWLLRTSDLSQEAMISTFNCGIGLILVVDKLRTVSALKRLRDLGEKPFAIGALAQRPGGDAIHFSGSLQG